MAFVVVQWMVEDGATWWEDTGVRAATYGQAEAEGARLHLAAGPRSRFLPMTAARAAELGAFEGQGF